jgi:tetratricopeptide (TPR) repeat protein
MLINRPNSGRPRLFPDPAQVASGDADQTLFSVSRSPFGLFRGRQPASRLGYVLSLHRAAIQAEIEGRSLRADFYWQERDRHLCFLTRQPGVLTALLQSVIVATVVNRAEDSEDLGSVFVDEVLIDVHAAFFNGRAQGISDLTLDDRAFFHFSQIEKLVSHSSLCPADRTRFLLPVWLHRGRALRNAKRWTEAVALAETRLAADPHDINAQNWLVETWFEFALSSLSTDRSESSARAEAQALRKALDALEKFCTNASHNADLYKALCNLYHMLAIKCANANRPSEALLLVQKALTINPDFSQGQQTKSQLSDMMRNLQSRMKEIEAQIRSRPNRKLTGNGQALQREAETGFGPINRFIDSKEAQSLQQLARESRNRAIWREVGFPDPEERFDEKAALLLEALGEVAAANPPDKASIEELWRRVASRHQDLETLNIQNVSGFLANRLLDEPYQVTAGALPESWTTDPPILCASTENRRNGYIPLAAWVYGGQDIGLKLRLVATVILVGIAGVLFIHDKQQRDMRDDAYDIVLSRGAKSDYSGVVNAANEFFSAQPFSRDPREEDVRAASQEALVRWVSSLHGDLTPAEQNLIARYRQIVEPP